MPPPLPYQVPNVPQTQDVGGRSMKRPKTDDFASENKEYAIPAANWIQSEPSTIPKGPNDPSLPYWRVGNGHGSPVAPAYTQFTPPSQTPRHSNWSPSTVEPGQREQMGWGVPQRTMSYGSLEGLQHQPPFPTFHPAAGQGSLREVYSPKPGGHQSNAYSSVHTPSSMASDVNSRTITDVSAHASGPAQPPNYGTTQSWQSPYPYDKTSLPAPSTGVYTPWYNAGGVISSQPQSGPENTTSAAYSHPEAYNGMMYYAPTR
ncbi:MAG: hypothetical protein M1818_008533 [Claussenomyces sp. TS43310]|nr:MAG: hypothetical protein M1818_008533 [Claussenomyces sp. TS43310]